MRLFPVDLEIGDEEGFTPAKDIFKRQVFGQGLTRLVGSVDDSLVLALDGAWGSGKTTFLRMWAGSLRQAGFPVIYYDAFQDDHHQDAFLALTGQIGVLAQKSGETNQPAFDRYMRAAKKLGTSLLKRSPRVAIRVASAGLIDLADLEGVADTAVETVRDEAEDIFSTLLDEYLKDQDTRQQFRNCLTSLAGDLGEADAQPLIFIIDELDRCRPNFALEILENLKHFFSVPGIKFVLGANMAQLENSISAAYGAEIDARTYLQKFIHLRLRLPEQDFNGASLRSSYVHYLLNAHEIDLKDDNRRYEIFEEIGRIAEAGTLSFRHIERIIAYATLCLAFLPPRYYVDPDILAGLFTLRVLAPEKHQMALDGTLKYADVVDILGLRASNVQDYKVEVYETIWKYFCNEELSEEKRQQMQRGLFQYSIGRESALRVLASTISDSFLIQQP